MPPCSCIFDVRRKSDEIIYGTLLGVFLGAIIGVFLGVPIGVTLESISGALIPWSSA